MKIKSTLILFLSLFLTFSYAQKAPDFTLDDIDGKNFNLYETLDDGKVVIIDFMTTWCEPCWAGHLNGYLKRIHNKYGPDGLDQVRVLMMEVDPNTGDDCLYGDCANNRTIGDWVTGTPYRIFNPVTTEIADTFGITGYPTIIVISPLNKEVVLDLRGGGEGPLIDILSETVLKKDEEIAISSYNISSIVCENISGDFTFQNGSENVYENPSFDVYLDGEFVENILYEGKVESLEEVTLDVSVPLGTKKFRTLSVKFKEGDNYPNNNEFSHQAKIGQSDQLITIKVKQRALEDHGSYEILNAAGEVVGESGYLTYARESELEFQLEDLGCHEIIFKSSKATGFSGNNAVVITDSGGHEIFNGEIIFEKHSIGFDVSDVSSIKDIQNLAKFGFSPNPVNDELNINYSLKEAGEVRFSIINQIGQKVASKDVGSKTMGIHNLVFETASLDSGIYFLQIQIDGQTQISKFIKQ